MKTVTCLVFTIACFAITLPAAAQGESLSESEYKIALAKAFDTASARARRIFTEETYHTGSQVTGRRKIVSHFAGPDAKKMEVTEEFNGRKSKSDSVRIGQQFFCREGDKGWKQADKECAKGGKMMAIPDGKYEFSVESNPNDPAGRIYTRRATFTDSGNPERDAARLKFIEIKFATDESGAITRYTETRRGGIEPNGWSSTQVTRYDYQPADMKITDPTKGN